jgi:hypothetical protein
MNGLDMLTAAAHPLARRSKSLIRKAKARAKPGDNRLSKFAAPFQIMRKVHSAI